MYIKYLFSYVQVIALIIVLVLAVALPLALALALVLMPIFSMKEMLPLQRSKAK